MSINRDEIIMNNNWKDIWEKRDDNFETIDLSDEKSVFLELKRIDGFDVVRGGIPYSALIKQHETIISRLNRGRELESIFEVGCGCGANLYLLIREGYLIGGMDYSLRQIEIAKKIFSDKQHNVCELICDEALHLPTDRKYEALFSNSVFSYFPDEKYAETVLDKMFAKTKYSIGLIDIHDIEKKNQFEEYRRRTVADYDEKYKDLKKLFYSKSFFREWARKNSCEIQFFDSDVEGYWNNQFVFDVYMYKKS